MYLETPLIGVHNLSEMLKLVASLSSEKPEATGRIPSLL
jgi:hypothetical protein